MNKKTYDLKDTGLIVLSGVKSPEEGQRVAIDLGESMKTAVPVLVISDEMQFTAVEFWFVGSILYQEEKEIGWMPEGLFTKEEEAAKAAKPGEFILLVEFGRFPKEATDAKKMYFPNEENWKDSALYKVRNS